MASIMWVIQTLRVMWDPCIRATTLCMKSFAHGSCKHEGPPQQDFRKPPLVRPENQHAECSFSLRSRLAGLAISEISKSVNNSF